MCSAFFSGMEIAFISINKLDVKIAGNKGGRASRLLQFFKKRSSHFIGTTLLANNIALVFFGLLIDYLLDPWFRQILPTSLSGDIPLLLLITLVSTVIILFAGEFIPKNLFRDKPMEKLLRAIPIFYGAYWLLSLPVYLIVALSRFFLGEEQDMELQETGFSRIDLEHYVRRMQDNVSEESEITTDIFSKTLNLSQIKARECIVPRNEIEGVEENADLEEIKQKFIETRFSKIIVYKENIDQPVGYLHHLDILKGIPEPVIHKLKIYPETKAARDILQDFIKTRKSIALIVDEYGGTAGIVTIEDIIEEIFGEIEDEHDDEKLLKEKISSTQFRFSGRVEIDLINEEFGLNIPEGDYETIAGYIIENHESIPEKRAEIIIDGFRFEIVEATPTKIEEIYMVILEED